MKFFFKELFEYTHHHNGQLIGSLAKSGDRLPDKAGKIFSHILNSHQIWNSRILGEGKPFGVWQVHEPATYSAIAENNHKNSLGIIDRFNLDEVVVYSNSQGQKFENSVRDMLFQVVNHSTYHRGQLATIFRENGIEPLLTDYIFYKR